MAVLLAAVSCGDSFATIDPSQAQPDSDLSGLEVPEGVLVALPDGRVFDVRGPEASHGTRLSRIGRGSTLALDGTDWKEVADPPPFNPTIAHSPDGVRVLGEDKIAVVGTECVGARVPDQVEECDDAYVQVVSVLDTTSGEWSERRAFEVPNVNDEPQADIVATEGDELLVHSGGWSGAMLWLDPYSGEARPAEGFVAQQANSVCDLGEEGVLQIVNRTTTEQRSQSRVDPEDPEADQGGVSLEPKPSKLDVLVSRDAKTAEQIASIPTESKVTPNDLGTPTACGEGNVAVLGSPDPTDQDVAAMVEIRDGTSFDIVGTIEVASGSALKADPPAIVNPVEGETVLLSADLTKLGQPLGDPGQCRLLTLNDQTYCEEEGQLSRVAP